jgi:hypothetical protein
VIAHVGGVPLEEALLPLASWAGAGLVLARACLAARVRRSERVFDDRCAPGLDEDDHAIARPQHV